PFQPTAIHQLRLQKSGHDKLDFQSGIPSSAIAKIDLESFTLDFYFDQIDQVVIGYEANQVVISRYDTTRKSIAHDDCVELSQRSLLVNEHSRALDPTTNGQEPKS